MRPEYNTSIEIKRIQYLQFIQSNLIRKFNNVESKILNVIENIPLEIYFEKWNTVHPSDTINLPEKPLYTFYKSQYGIKKLIREAIGQVYYFDMETMKNYFLIIFHKYNLYDPLNNDIVRCNEILQNIFKQDFLYIPELDHLLEPLFTKLPNILQILLNKQRKNQNKLSNPLKMNQQCKNNNNNNISKENFSLRNKGQILVSLTRIDHHLVFWTELFEYDQNIISEPNALYMIESKLHAILEKYVPRNKKVFSIKDIYVFFLHFIKEHNLVNNESIINISNTPLLRKLLHVNIFHKYQISRFLEPFIKFVGLSISNENITEHILKYIPIVKYEY